MSLERELVFKPQALEDLIYWAKNKPRHVSKVLYLLEHCSRDPYIGVGKPEPLKYQYSGMWSRRIDKVHRLIYEVNDQHIVVHACRYHY